VKDTNLQIPYHHVSLIFDEAELYYHPEFQRDFIAKIIQFLAWCHIDARRIRSVNITVVTHSPFVLSDVMNAHTLNMSQGVVSRKEQQTFGANIHELLYGQLYQ
jgi:predicted ATP-dependent endonuclease of OLD family